jgi:hypothetical protein
MYIKVCPKGCHVGSFSDKFCRKCGAPLVEKNLPEKAVVSLSCTNPDCEAPILQDDKFCGVCGHIVLKDDAI